VKRSDVANGDPQTVDHRLAAADTLETDNVRMLSLHHVGHADTSR
jgi:hypothetical protein